MDRADGSPLNQRSSQTEHLLLVTVGACLGAMSDNEPFLGAFDDCWPVRPVTFGDRAVSFLELPFV